MKNRTYCNYEVLVEPLSYEALRRDTPLIMHYELKWQDIVSL
jgi:hypothetical protein